ncbi:MAG: hypothetical protein WB815_13075 [Nitrososphaeraceae archaeon]
MNQKTIAIAAVLMATALTGISATTTFAYAEYDDCEYSIESRTTVCEGNGIETTYSAMPMDDDTTAEETMDTSFLADDQTDAMGSAAEDADDAEDEAEDAADEEEDAADDAEDDADEAEEDTEVETTN